MGGDSFETVYNKAQSKWDNQLGIITDVKGANYEQLVTLVFLYLSYVLLSKSYVRKYRVKQ